jgi:cytochrome P450
MHRLPRISPDISLQYKHYTIPSGIPVGMSNYFMHTDPAVFPDPFTSKPDRWLQGNVTSAMLRNYVPFGRESRNCLGQQYVQLYLHLVFGTKT